MPINRNLFLLFAGLLCFTGCCTKVDCASTPTSYVEAHGFAPGTANSFQLITYVAGMATDSEQVATYEGGPDHVAAYFQNPLSTPKTYTLTVLPAGDVFTLRDFEIGREGCNSCFPARPQSDYYPVLKSYFVNEVQQYGATISLRK